MAFMGLGAGIMSKDVPYGNGLILLVLGIILEAGAFFFLLIARSEQS
jgi:hypothetical protein